MKVATFNEGAWAGRPLIWENDNLTLDREYSVSHQHLKDWDAAGLLVWESADLKQLVYGTKKGKGAPWGGFVLSILGIWIPILLVVGFFVSRAQKKRAAEEGLPGGLAKAGYIISIVGMSFWVIYLTTMIVLWST